MSHFSSCFIVGRLITRIEYRAVIEVTRSGDYGALDGAKLDQIPSVSAWVH